MSAGESGRALWHYSLDLYAKPGVSSALIGLQNRRGADVNLLLLCCFAATSGCGRLSGEELRRLDAAIKTWRDEVTRPLRKVRERIKGTTELWGLDGAADVRGQVLGAEIESERVCQGILQRLAPAPGHTAGGREDASASIEAYFDLLGTELCDEDRGALEMLLDSAFG